MASIFKSRKTPDGRLLYEISPGRWVSRQRVNQLRNRKAHRARQVVKSAIRNGTIKRNPCEVCGAFPAESHHISYDHPYLVRWLCRPHHDHVKPHLLSQSTIQPPQTVVGRPKGRRNYPRPKLSEIRVITPKTKKQDNSVPKISLTDILSSATQCPRSAYFGSKWLSEA